MYATQHERIAQLEQRMATLEARIGSPGATGKPPTAHPSIEEANPQLGTLLSLPEFLAMAEALSPAERRTVVEQALVLIDDLYVHLPLKRAMHAVDPVQRLKLLRKRSNSIGEREFHDEMIATFKALRDLHTNYILPAPYNQHTAFLPFLMEEYWENGERHYVVTRTIAGFTHETFGPGVEITHWSGAPIDRAVARVAETEAGSNEPAQHVRGLDAMTVRPMSQSLPPDAEWVIVGYRHGGVALEIRLPWRVFHPDPASALPVTHPFGVDTRHLVAQGVDLEREQTNQARKLLFAPEAHRLREEANELVARGAGAPIEAFKAENSLFPDVFEFRDVETPQGVFGHLRIRTFSLPPDQFIPELVRILGLVSQNGLIIDVRGNGGGYITSGERALQLFTDRKVEAERLQFINTDLTLSVARSTALDSFAQPWLRSIELALETGAVYSQGFPIEPPEDTNSIGRRYGGQAILVTDARCYSTTDIFAAGFQDNRIGPILGVDDNTGAGGANVFTHELVQRVLPGSASPILPLPKGATFRVAIRRTTRVGDNAGLPLEDLGVRPNATHRLTRRDVLGDNADLINEAARVLSAS